MTGLDYTDGNYSDLSNFLILSSKPLGEGNGGAVYLALHSLSNKKFAIKTTAVNKKTYQNFQREINILRSITQHDNIISLNGAFENNNQSYMVMPFIEDGNLLSNLSKNGRYTELQARKVTEGILRGIGHLHRHNVVHRDIKPENILIDKRNEAKIADFGFATCITRPSSLTTFCGSFIYAAPEILSHVPYGEAVDLWGVGVTLFIMLGNYYPFYDRDERMNNHIYQYKIDFIPKYWCSISSAAKNLVADLLTVSPHERPSANEALNYPWLEHKKN
uniref:Protein kinase domain-containing protein n=1 Tax=Corethron hystrix TaxID=216773 RepID=A0A7S1FNY0_9STRA|mmetsp:Transcript_19403/g.44204  ORF Transcript_19403/g.44204 Transcript_19403/m.44204 type:complete len:276 (+) Transcript_19403:95-922(+)